MTPPEPRAERAPPFMDHHPDPGVNADAAPVLDVQGLSVSYGRQPALRNISLQITKGEIYGVVGPNGAGKSTLVKAVCGRAPASSGAVRIDGAPAGAKRARARLGVAPQRPALYDRLTGAENLVAFGRQAGLSKPEARARAETLLRDVGARASASIEARRLSGGARQRLNIAAALMHGPSLLILDEPSANLDPQGTAELNELVSGLRITGVGVLLITHDMAQASALCTRVGVFAGGRKAAEGAPRELIERHAEDGVEILVELAAAPANSNTDEKADTIDLDAYGLSGRRLTRADGRRYRCPAASYADAAAVIARLEDIENRAGVTFAAMEIVRPCLGRAVAACVAASMKEAS